MEENKAKAQARLARLLNDCDLLSLIEKAMLYEANFSGSGECARLGGKSIELDFE